MVGGVLSGCGGGAAGGVAVAAPVDAGVVGADVHALHAAAGRALAAVLFGLEGAAHQPAQPLAVDAGAVLDTVGSVVPGLGAGVQGQAVLSSSLPQAGGCLLHLSGRGFPEQAAVVGVVVRKAQNAPGGAGGQTAAERPKAPGIPGGGALAVQENGVEAPVHPNGAEPLGQLFKGSEAFLQGRQAGLPVCVQGGDGVLEQKVPVAQGLHLPQQGQKGDGVFRPKDDGVHGLRGKEQPGGMAGPVGLGDEHLPGLQAAQQPRTIEGGQIRAAAGAENHRGPPFSAASILARAGQKEKRALPAPFLV